MFHTGISLLLPLQSWCNGVQQACCMPLLCMLGQVTRSFDERHWSVWPGTEGSSAPACSGLPPWQAAVARAETADRPLPPGTGKCQARLEEKPDRKHLAPRQIQTKKVPPRLRRKHPPRPLRLSYSEASCSCSSRGSWIRAIASGGRDIFLSRTILPRQFVGVVVDEPRKGKSLTSGLNLSDRMSRQRTWIRVCRSLQKRSCGGHFSNQGLSFSYFSGVHDAIQNASRFHTDRVACGHRHHRRYSFPCCCPPCSRLVKLHDDRNAPTISNKSAWRCIIITRPWVSSLRAIPSRRVR